MTRAKHAMVVASSAWSRQPLGRKIRDLLRFVSLFFIPSRRGSSTLYDLISTTNYFTERTLFRNLGFWRDAPATLDDACEAMARLAGETAGLDARDRVLDAGFGFGDQDLYWMEHFAPREIVGINVTRSQLEVAQARVADRGLSDRIVLQHGSATELPFEAGSFDKVIALESAFHFHTREDFFREAFRVLRPGGRIVLLDMIPIPGLKLPIWMRMALTFSFQVWQMPAKNLYDRDVYADKLRAAGFTSARVESIREHVGPHFTRYIVAQLAKPEVRERINPAVRWMFHPSGVDDVAKIPTGGFEFDYVLASADKP
jgi:ubiquinone/menaquinone biosynthesis C-methylase UbiE